MREITVAHLDDLAMGAAVLGTGGGGDPYIGKLMARKAMAGRPAVQLLDFADLDDDALVVPSAMIGAPTVMVEKVPSGKEAIAAFRALESFMGRRIDATMPIEIGGMNSLMPFTVAAELGLPMVDGDGMGRAFPELQMVTQTIAGLTASPMGLSDEKGNSLILNTITNQWAETFARTATVQMGAAALMAIFPMTGAEVKRACIPGTLTLIGEIGRAIREAHAAHRDAVAAVCAVTGGVPVWTGKVGDIERRTIGGFARGTARVEGNGDHTGRTLEVDFQNEFLIARSGEDVLVTTPDLITMLDAETGEPITTEQLRYGFRVVVIGIPSHRLWRTEMGLALTGPGYFAYDLEFFPLESRYPEARHIS
jgi:DUF917 family protein